MVRHIMVPTLVWAVGQFSLMMLTVPQGLTNCYNATAGQFYIITATILLMLVWVVKVNFKTDYVLISSCFSDILHNKVLLHFKIPFLVFSSLSN